MTESQITSAWRTASVSPTLWRRDSVDLCTFEFSSFEVASILAEASQSGAQVRIISEQRKSFAPTEIRHLLDFRNVAYYQHVTDSGPHSIHQKSAILDDTELVFGSANISDASFYDRWELNVWTDCPHAVKKAKRAHDYIERYYIRQPGSRDVTCRRAALDHLRSLLAQNSWSNDSVIPKAGSVELYFSHEDNLPKKVASLFKHATNKVEVYASHRLSTAFYNFLDSFADRGGIVLLIKDHSAVQHHDFSRPYTRLVADKGKMHIKAICIDDQYIGVGSLNLFERSLFCDQELFAVSNNASLNAEILDHLSRVRSRSFPIRTRDRIKHTTKETNKRLRSLGRKTLTSVNTKFRKRAS